MSEIHALAERVESLSKQADWWNNWMLWGLVVGAIAALLVLISSERVMNFAKKKEEAQADLIRAKDRQLALELSQKDIRISEAQKEASDANERATANEIEAARLNKLAEDERLSRVKLEKQLAPREISGRDALIQLLKPFAPRFKGRKIAVSSYSADAEGIVFSVQINNLLYDAGFDVEQIIGRKFPVGIPTIGIKITGPTADSDFIREFATELHQRLIKEVSNIETKCGNEFTQVEVSIGVKPIVGLPQIMMDDSN